MATKFAAQTLITAALLASAPAFAPGTVSLLAQSTVADAAVQRVLDDYIGLYRKDTLERWKTLFLPSFTATYTNADGSVSSRTLNEFYEAQRRGFAAGEMSETLQNVSIQRTGRLAHASAAFRFTSRGVGRDGKLMLLLIEERGQLKIAALVFTYHLAGTP